ncbi:hypothetical protein K438DRAFT_596706 [Mycena galopus ATCC 62051]|nr:hypothetical protein K438DRAFT_596706 [Mycena galopus ATCC 62051]
MPTTPLSIRTILLEQIARTRQTSKSDITRSLEESELKITALQSQIDALVELRDRELACSAALRYIISPVYTLPVELLAEIFKLAIGDYAHIKDAHGLSQVCVDWRQVAHGTPQLWAGHLQMTLVSDHIEVSTGPQLRISAPRLRRRDYSEVDPDGSILKAWLARSAPLPIQISLIMALSDISWRMLEDVLSIAPRCRFLQLEGQPGPIHQLLLGLAQSKLDILEELNLPDKISGGVDFISIPKPRLRSLSIYIISNLSQILMPWSQLTDLTLNVNSSNIAIDVLAQCANLVRASVTSPGWAELPQGPEILALTLLRTLSVRFCGAVEHVTPFFDCISAPMLQELCVNSTRSDFGLWTEAHFTAFQLRASHLTRLDFNGADLTSDDLLAAIIHAPALTHLLILSYNDCFDDGLIGALYFKDGVVPLVPHLHHLVFENNAREKVFTEDILAGMILSRWWTDAQLASRVVPPAVARWTHVELRWLDRRFFDMLKELPPDVLIRTDEYY